LLALLWNLRNSLFCCLFQDLLPRID
jgi:hypothetical protein